MCKVVAHGVRVTSMMPTALITMLWDMCQIGMKIHLHLLSKTLKALFGLTMADTLDMYILRVITPTYHTTLLMESSIATTGTIRSMTITPESACTIALNRFLSPTFARVALCVKSTPSATNLLLWHVPRTTGEMFTCGVKTQALMIITKSHLSILHSTPTTTRTS